jgi:hypothetical protein
MHFLLRRIAYGDLGGELARDNNHTGVKRRSFQIRSNAYLRG